MDRVTFYTQASNLGRPDLGTRYPRSYNRVAGISLGDADPLWVNKVNTASDNTYDPASLSATELELPSWLARGVVRYFKAHYVAVTKEYDRSCHHFARTIVDPPVPDFTPFNDASFLVACAIAERGDVANGPLSAGVHGVYGVKSTYGGIGYHSVVGLGHGDTYLQVISQDGNMGLSNHEAIVENVTATAPDLRAGQPVRLYVTPPSRSGADRARSNRKPIP